MYHLQMCFSMEDHLKFAIGMVLKKSVNFFLLLSIFQLRGVKGTLTLGDRQLAKSENCLPLECCANNRVVFSEWERLRSDSKKQLIFDLHD